MSTGLIKQVRTAIANLNPSEIREAANQPIQVVTLASSPQAYQALESFLAPPTLNENRRWVSEQSVRRSNGTDSTSLTEILFIEEGLPLPMGWVPGRTSFRFKLSDLEALPKAVIEQRDDLMLPLARRFEPFRSAAIHHSIQTVAKENAVFSLMTALPNILPNPLQLPWVVGEFASDTAVLTANQIRMAFLIAAASDQPVGYSEQKSAVGSIIAGAWGWRSIARELIGKVPFGGGLVPKAAVAYAGTFIVGQSLERFYRKGYGLTKSEKIEAYKSAFEKGKMVASAILQSLRKDKA